MNVVLIGFRGSGKTTTGRVLAERLKLEFVDTDEEVERSSGKTIAEIFESDGEPGFRELERDEVLKACRRDRCVIALGGGAVENPDLAAAAKKTGLVVLLSAPAQVLHRRIERDRASGAARPALTRSSPLNEVKELLAHRRAAYLDAAHVEVDTSALDAAGAAQRIIALLEGGRLGKRFSQIIA